MASGISNLFNALRNEALTPQQREERENIITALKVVQVVAAVLSVSCLISFIQAPHLAAAIFSYVFYEVAMVAHNVLSIFQDALTELATTLSKEEYLKVATENAPITRLFGQTFRLHESL